MQAPIFHTFDEAGFYTGSAPAPFDPVQGGWAEINPQAATVVAPPSHDPESYRARLADGVWTLEEVPGPEPEPGTEPLPDLPPTRCTRRQGRLALLTHGHLDDVEAAMAAMPDDAEGRAAQIEYEADTWEIENPFVQAMWAKLGGTPEQLQDLFVMAVSL